MVVVYVGANPNTRQWTWHSVLIPSINFMRYRRSVVDFEGKEEYTIPLRQNKIPRIVVLAQTQKNAMPSVVEYSGTFPELEFYRSASQHSTAASRQTPNFCALREAKRSQPKRRGEQTDTRLPDATSVMRSERLRT